jgi:hypothetical protein
MSDLGIRRAISLALGLGLSLSVAVAWAGGVPTSSVLEEVTVVGKLDQLIGKPISASLGRGHR